MALTVAMVGRNPFVLEEARRGILEAHAQDGLVCWGHSTNCRVEFEAGQTVVKFLSESDWRRGAYSREHFDQIFRVGSEPLGIDFMLELQECLKGSCVPERWQWQKWEGGQADG